MNENRLRQLESFGQSSWMDISRRGIVLSDELKQLIDENERGGVTSNLAVFEKAISDGRMRRRHEVNGI